MSEEYVQTEIVQNECADFYPPKDLNNLIEQLYNHMEFDCLYNSHESNLFLTGVPIIIRTAEMSRKEIDALIREKNIDPASEFCIVQSEYSPTRSNATISIHPTPKMKADNHSIFYNRRFPENMPKPKIESYSPILSGESILSGTHPENTRREGWGDYRILTEAIWEKGNSQIIITSGYNPGEESFFMWKRFR